VRDIREGRVPAVPPVPPAASRQQRPPVISEGASTGMGRDPVDGSSNGKQPGLKLREKTSTRWKRLSGRFRGREK
jgi:hypothetical protein